MLTKAIFFSRIFFAFLKILHIVKGLNSMDLKEYFANLCRESASALITDAPSIQKLTSPRNKSQIEGVRAVYSFDGFKVLISYIESGRAAYAQQTIWVSVSLDCDRSIPFSLYDILAFIEPTDFNCYTYTYVDSQELMKSCLCELTEVLKKICPVLSEFLEDGICKNKLISSQKDCINRYFGDAVFESSEMLGGAADKIIAMMLQNFYEAEIESAVIGTQAYFYNGNDEKALKKLKKSKRKTIYQQNLQKYLECGGTSESISKTAKEASAKKGVLRHGGGVKSSLKMIGLSLLFTIPVSLLLALVYMGLSLIIFKGSIFAVGYKENLILLPFFSFLSGIAVALNLLKHREENKKHKNAKTIHSPKAPKAVNEVLKYFTIVAESLALIGCLTCVFSSTPFYESSFRYSQEEFPLSQSSCDYSSVDFIGVIEGFYSENKFYEEKYIVIRTVSGQTIDLYNSTWLSFNDFMTNENFFKEKGIEIKSFKTFEEYETYK